MRSNFSVIVMFAIIETGGKQYTVTPSQTVEIEKLVGETGENVVFDKVLLYANEGDVKLGKPYLEGAKVSASIVEQGKGQKIRIFKYKAKSRYRRTTGHRQLFTAVKINEITA